MNENPNQIKASAEFTQTVISGLATDKGVHAETAISAAARMAGTFALRSCGLPLSQFTPGTSILGDVIDEQGQKVLATVDETLASLNVRLDAEKLDYDLPEANSPRMELDEVQSVMDAAYRAIADKYHLSNEETAHAAAMSTAVLIQRCSGVLDPHLGYTIAVYGMVEGSKTVPYNADAEAAVGR
jgi:hypothetical protein